MRTVGGTAYFNSLTSTEGLGNLQKIGRDANFQELTSAQGLKNLQTIEGSAYFENLTNYSWLYEYTPNSIRTVVKYLKGQLTPLGKLPIKL